jgi:acyl-CoA reductase-like NAD-dependent aldehyde dehydrogenase
MGESDGQSRKEIEKCALVCRYYAENAATLLADEDVKTEATKVILPFNPIGVIFGGNAMELSILSSYSLCYSIINGKTQEF